MVSTGKHHVVYNKPSTEISMPLSIGAKIETKNGYQREMPVHQYCCKYRLDRICFVFLSKSC